VKPFFPIPFGAGCVQEAVILAALFLEEETEVEKRLRWLIW
jgi:hypothetical protein